VSIPSSVLPTPFRQYAVFRISYRGDGGCSWALAHGSLGNLVPKYLNTRGTSALQASLLRTVEHRGARELDPMMEFLKE
jgi:hypothetical protein